MKPPLGASSATVPSFHKKGDTATHSAGLPMVEISAPTNLDVLCGRGVATNRHIGNENFRALVKCHKKRYICSSKAAKMKLSRFIVETIRAQDGRFLEKCAATDLWTDIGDKKAIEKTSQALRDGAAPLRRKLAADADLQERSVKDKYTSFMEENSKKRNVLQKVKKEKLGVTFINDENNKTTEVGKNTGSKDFRVKRKRAKPKTAKKSELKLPPLFPKMISTDSLPLPTQGSLTAPSSSTHLAAVTSSIQPNPIPQPSTNLHAQDNFRRNSCFSPIPFSQGNYANAAVKNATSPAPINTRLEDDFSFPHHIPVVEENGWAPSRQTSPNNESYNRSCISYTPPQGSEYDYSVSPVGVPSSPHPALISPPHYRAPTFQHHERYPPSCPLPQHNLYTPAIGNIDSCNAGSHHAFPHAPSACSRLRIGQNHLLGAEEEKQELMQMNRSDRMRENQEFDMKFSLSNSVNPSLEDVSDYSYDSEMPFSPNDMAPLPYKSDNECSSSVTTSFTSEDDILGCNVPDGYELKHKFLMNLIRSPLLE